MRRNILKYWVLKMIKAIFILGAFTLLIVFFLIPGSGLILFGLLAGGSWKKNEAFRSKQRGIKTNNKSRNGNQRQEIYPRLIRIDNRLQALETILPNR